MFTSYHRPFLFLLVIDWIMKTTIEGRKNGIRWNHWVQLDNLDLLMIYPVISQSSPDAG